MLHSLNVKARLIEAGFAVLISKHYRQFSHCLQCPRSSVTGELVLLQVKHEASCLTYVGPNASPDFVFELAAFPSLEEPRHET
jgi:hypothetical protein